MSLPSLIRRLPPETVSLMVAGEMIDSLAAAVRELIENALDAGSTHITIDLWPQQWQVRVSDNGSGLSATDLAEVALPHTTSKLQALVPPFAVNTLGFRGQALSSLAQMGELSLASRAVSDPHGWWVSYDSEGRIRTQRPQPMAVGTTVTVQHLFAQWSGRRQALQHHRAEVKRVITVVQKIALTHPSITWILNQEDKPLLTIWPGDSAADLVPQFIPRLQREDLRLGQGHGWEVVIGIPDRCHRPKPDWMRVAVNGRFVSAPELVRTVQTCLQQTVPKHRFPLALVMLQVDPLQVDWNRHPAKTEVYLQQLEHHQATLQEVIAQTLQSTTGLPSQRTLHLLREKPSSYGSPPAATLEVNPTPRILGQLQLTYILLEHDGGLWLVEQHVAHERIRYEAIVDHWQGYELEDPLLLDPFTAEQAQTLQQMGLTLEPFGVDTWRILQIPQVLQEAPAAEQIEVLRELSRCGDLQAMQVMLACRTAVRNGTPLTPEQMQSLIQRWQASDNPHTCPHGRPIYLALSDSELSRFFRRNWSVCDTPRLGSAPAGLGDLLAQDIRSGSKDHSDL